MLGTTKLCNITDSEDVFVIFVSANIFSISLYQHTLQRRITSQYLPPKPGSLEKHHPLKRCQVGKGLLFVFHLDLPLLSRFPRLGFLRSESLVWSKDGIPLQQGSEDNCASEA